MSTYTPKRGRRGLRLVVALALATTAAGGVFVYASSVQRKAAQQQQQLRQEVSADPTQTPLVSVLVAHVDLQPKTRLTPDAFELRELPADAVASNAVKSLEAVAGKQLHVSADALGRDFRFRGIGGGGNEEERDERAARGIGHIGPIRPA